MTQQEKDIVCTKIALAINQFDEAIEAFPEYQDKDVRTRMLRAYVELESLYVVVNKLPVEDLSN